MSCNPVKVNYDGVIVCYNVSVVKHFKLVEVNAMGSALVKSASSYYGLATLQMDKELVLKKKKVCSNIGQYIFRWGRIFNLYAFCLYFCTWTDTHWQAVEHLALADTFLQTVRAHV